MSEPIEVTSFSIFAHARKHRRQHEPALVIARELLGVREQMAHERPVARVLDGRGFEARAEFVPDGGGVERQARVGLGDGYEKAGTEPLPEARGNDETAFVVKAVFHRSGEQGPIRAKRVLH